MAEEFFCVVLKLNLLRGAKAERVFWSFSESALMAWR
jgi:hypothetical protein